MKKLLQGSALIFFFFFFCNICGHVVTEKTINIKDSIQRIKDCYSADKNQFNKCLFEFWKEVRPMLAVGIPELKVPILDPLFIHQMEVSENGAVVQGRATFHNLTVKGLANYVPKSVSVDILNQSITVEIFIPKMDIDGAYDVDGTALLLPVKGNGEFFIKLVGIEGKADAMVEREGTGMRLAKTLVDFTIKNISAHMENLLGGEEVGEAVNNIINDNAQEILKDVKPLVSTKLGQAITKVLEGAVKELPGEAFILPESFVPPEGFVIPEAFSFASDSSSSKKP